MPTITNLSLEEVEAYLKFFDMPSVSPDEFLPIRIAQQLADCMRECEGYKNAIKIADEALIKSCRENERLREALEYYSDSSKWPLWAIENVPCKIHIPDYQLADRELKRCKHLVGTIVTPQDIHDAEDFLKSSEITDI